MWVLYLIYINAAIDFRIFLYELFRYYDLYLFFTLFFIFFLTFFWLVLLVVMYFEVYNWTEDQLSIIINRIKINYIEKKIKCIKTDDCLKISPKKNNFFSLETNLYVKYLILKKKIIKIWKKYV